MDFFERGLMRILRSEGDYEFVFNWYWKMLEI